MEENIKRGQIIKIRNEEYIVDGMIEFSEDTWKWKEYKLTSSEGKTIWLCIEKEDNGKDIYSIYNENSIKRKTLQHFLCCKVFYLTLEILCGKLGVFHILD